MSSVTDHAIDKPSKVEVPRPISSNNTNELFVFDSSGSKLTKSFFKGHEIHDLTDLFFDRMEINLPASILQDKLWKK